ncbi:hypothetical protein GWI33_016297 [Rhynchophorus ferrugineus]|uniref:Polycystic kidney disease 2-like 1 protein n=1 Tax=Rhynchophorus ferrugineus TaxID=354439 RepID=A0A834I1Z2_RHYFE|nr:hypothetical protein GWI33_016297 [Rhynchophorus ferrugineus]
MSSKNVFEDRKYARKKKPFWVTAAIATEIGREELLASTFREIIFHTISLILLSIYIFNRISVSEYYVTAALKSSLGIREDGEFHEVISVAKLWEYLGDTVVNAFHKTDMHENSVSGIDSMYMLNENKVLGVPRIRQVKVRSDSCEIHGYFRRLFRSCYSKFTSEAEDRTPFGLKTATAWVYSDSSTTKSLNYQGTLTTYSGGGFYVDFNTDPNSTSDMIDVLKDNLWITRGTRAVFIDFSIYNPNLNLFCISKLIFEFLPSGGVKPNFRFTPAVLIEFAGLQNWMCKIALYFFGVYVIFCLFEEFREMLYFSWSYFAKFWNYIDISVIVLTFLLITGTEYLRFIGKSYLDEIKNNPNSYGNLEYLEIVYSTVNVIGALLLFFVYMRTFKYLNFNKRMAQLNDTIKNCSKDILGFSVMFFVAYFAYAELGYLVFGSEVKSYSSFGLSMFTLLRTILGDFDYEEIHVANWFVAPIYFLSFIILVFFVLLNMFLAIINDTYADVKTDIAIAPKEIELTDYLRRGFKNILRRIGCKVRSEAEEKGPFNINIRKIRDALIKCNFEDREIEMFFTRYDINPLKDLKKEHVEKFFEKFALEEEDRKSGRDKALKWEDFQRQDMKLNELEKSLIELGERVHELLSKLESTQETKKVQ